MALLDLLFPLTVKPPRGLARVNLADPLTRDLFAYLHLNEGGGPPLDLVSRQPAAMGSGVSWSAGERGFAPVWDSTTNAWLDGPRLLSGLDRDGSGVYKNWTLGGWVYLPNAAGSVSTHGHLFRVGDSGATTGFGVGIGNAGGTTETNGDKTIVLYDFVTWRAGSYTLTPGWRHILAVFTFTGGTTWSFVVYVDGVSRHTDSSTTNPTGTMRFVVGTDGTTGNTSTPARHWRERIGDAACWSRALSAEEVAQLYRRGPGALLEPLRFVITTTTPAQTARPVADVADGSWTNEAASNVDLYASIDEASASDVDYIQSSDSPAVADVAKVRLGALTDPAVGTGHIVRYRYLKSVTGGDQIDLVVTLYRADGTTAVASQTHTNIDAVTDGSFTLTAGEADSIPTGDYATGLVLGFSAIKV